MAGQNIPKETETIAVKRANRIAEKIRKTKKRFRKPKTWWNSTFAEVILVLFFVILNSYLIYNRIGSSAPETPFSGPVVPVIAKAWILFGFTFLQGVQITNIIALSLFPAAYYLFIRSVTDRKLAGLLAVLIVSLPIYPFAETRVLASLDAHDSAHIVSLTLIPLALVGVHGFIRNGGIKNLVIASLFTMLVILTSPFGFLTFVIFASITTFSEMLLGRGRLRIFRLITVFFFGIGLSAFWYNPAFMMWLVAGPLGSDLRGTISKLIPISFFTLPILAAFGYLLFDRKPQLQSVFLASFYTISFFIISTAGGGIFPSHPSRYVAEFGMSLAFLIGIIIVRLTDYLKLMEVKRLVLFRKFSLQLASFNKRFVHSLLVVLVLLLVVGVIIGKDKISQKSQVLGLWTEVEKGEIWVAKDKFNGVSQFAGYAITAASVGALGTVSKQSKKKNMYGKKS